MRVASPAVDGRHRHPSPVVPSRSAQAAGEKGVRVTPGFHLVCQLSSEIGASRPDGVAPLSRLSRGFEGTPAFRTTSPVRAGGESGGLGWPVDCASLFRFTQRLVSDNGVFETWPSGPLRRSTHSQLTAPRPVRQVPSGYQPEFLSKGRGSGAVLLTARVDFGRVGQPSTRKWRLV